ncbi:hypothetical protein [Roseibium sp.]|uniref:hypothetical protein n=1 Tax=Roseibium sp. TaxID=1936156 RepID=UPI003BAD8858
MMIEPRSTATIRALASLAELSADQLEDGTSVEEVIATLRKAAEAVRHVIDSEEQGDSTFAFTDMDIVQDLTPMDLGAEGVDESADAEESEPEETVLNAS